MASNTIDKLCAELQARIGILPKVSTDTFYLLNDARSAVEVIRVQPSSLSEIVRVVRAARSMKLHIRCCGVGSGFDYGMYADKNNVMIQTTKLCDSEKLEIVRLKRCDGTTEMGIRVLAGVRIQKLCDFEMQNQVCVLTNDEATHKTVVGAIISGSKGIGKDSGSLADQVMQVRLVDCNGDVRTFVDDGSDKNAKQLRSMVCGLGLLGVVYDVVLRAHPMQSVHVDYQFPKMSEIVDNPSFLKKTVDEHFSTQIVYIPFNSIPDDAEDAKSWDPTQDEVMVRKMSLLEVDIDQRHFIPLIEEVEPDLSFLDKPSYTPAAMKNTHNIHRRRFLTPSRQPLPWAIHSFGLHPKPIDMLSWSFGTGSDFSHIAQIIRELAEFIKQYAAENTFPLNVGIKINFTGATTVGMCPGKGDQPGTVANISLVSVVGTMGWKKFVAEICEKWLKDSSSFPHWSSTWSTLPGIDDHIRKVYEADINELKQLLEEMDRDGVFMNERLRSLLFPTLEGYREKYVRERSIIMAGL